MFGKRPLVSSLDGMVAAAHPLAASAGAGVLRQGGNAFDAAVATVAALNVVEPFMSGLAGLGMACVWPATERKVHCLDFITRIPTAFSGTGLSREALFRGASASAPPGNLAGWCELLRAHGSWPLAEVLKPAINLAREGFPVAEGMPAITREWFDVRSENPEWLRVYTNGSDTIEPGWLLRQPDLAGTLEAIASEGPGWLYGGKLGKQMVDHLQAAGGCLEMADLEAVAPQWLEPLSIQYRGHELHALPPPAEAFQFLLTLAALEPLELSRFEPGSTNHLDTVFRAARLASEVRVENNRAPRAVIEELLTATSAARLTEAIRERTPLRARMQRHAEMTDRRLVGLREHTTSLSVADRDGNLVCITQSLGSVYGSGVVIPGTGVCMNNFLNWGDLDPASPNALRAGEPMAMCLAPSIATRGGEAVLALGTPGSYGILHTQPQALVYHLDYGYGLQEAIEAPRARLWDGNLVHAESRFAADVIRQLRGRGHDVETVEPWTRKVGGFQGIARTPETGALTGAADPRRDGYAVAP